MGASGWDVYYLVFLAALLALALPIALAGVARLAAGRGSGVALQPVARPSNREAPRRINVRYFLAINSALVFLGIFFVAVPMVLNVARADNREELLRAIIAIVSVAAFSGLGLFYGSRKGDLSRVRAFEGTDPTGGEP